MKKNNTQYKISTGDLLIQTLVKKKSKIKLKITKDLILLISGIFSCALKLD